MIVNEALDHGLTGVVTFEFPSLGNRSYLIRSGSRGVLVDAPLAWWRIDEYLSREGIKLEAVVDTHIHNDFVSGSTEIADKYDCTHFCPALDSRYVSRSNAVSEARPIDFSFASLNPIYTPGHTLDHHSYMAMVERHGTGFLFSGGSWLRGSLGRVDLDQEEAPEILARKQVESVNLLARELDPRTKLRPTHGFGSYCSYTTSISSADTLEEDRQTNPYFTSDNPTELLLSNPLPVPPHFRKMSAINQAADTEVPFLNFDEFYSRALMDGPAETGTLIDLRKATDRHDRLLEMVPSLGVEGPFPVWFSWRPEYSECNTGVVEDKENAEKALEGLISIGVTQVEHFVEARHLSGLRPSGISTLEASQLDSYELKLDDVLIDLRHRGEWRLGHVRHSVNIPFESLKPVPEPKEQGRLIAYCGSGYRASMYLEKSSAKERVLVLGSPAKVLQSSPIWCALPHQNDFCNAGL